jgi:hypothetical protein
LEREIDPNTLVLQEEEVSEVRFFPWKELQKHVTDKDPEFLDETEYPQIFEYLSHNY